MTLEFRKLHPHFVAEASRVDLREAQDEDTLACLRRGMDRYAVLVFRDQAFTDEEQLAFAQRFDGALHRKTGASVLAKNRLGDEALTDVSNVGGDGRLLEAASRRRQYGLANRLWHTDASFQDPPGRYSMLMARVVPPVAADTELADMRTAYDTLPEGDEGEARRAPRAPLHRLLAPDPRVRVLRGGVGAAEGGDPPSWCGPFPPPAAARSISRPTPPGSSGGRCRTAGCCSATSWSTPRNRSSCTATPGRTGDFVIYDNRATMHRARPFEDTVHRRELRRVTTLDVEAPAGAARVA